MKHQIDTMTSINNLAKDYETTIAMLRAQNEQLRIDLEELRKENPLLRTAVLKLSTELSKIAKKEKGTL